MPLAESADVARAMRIEPTPDEPWAEKELETAESWARRYLRAPELGITEDVITTVDDVRCDGYIRVSGEPEAVFVTWGPGASEEEVATSAWDWDGLGVRLRPEGKFGPWIVAPAYDPRFESGPHTMPWYYIRVRIESKTGNTIDPVIRDAVALAAAAIITRGPSAAKGLTSERIGDYSYSKKNNAQANGDPFFEEAKSMLRPLRRTGPLTP